MQPANAPERFDQNFGKHQTHPLVMALVVLGFLVLIPVLVIAISSQDPLWFVKGFNDLPNRVVVYTNGGQKEYLPGMEGFDLLSDGVRASLDQGVMRTSGIGLSSGSLFEAYHKYTTVEAFFDHPVKLHASFATHQPTQMLFLITGRHSELQVVFMGVGGNYLSNAPRLVTFEPLRAALLALNYDLSPVR